MSTTAKRKARQPKPQRSVEQIVASPSCDIQEAARVMGVSHSSARRIVDEGHVHSFPVGRRRRVSVKSLLAFVDGQAKEAR